MTQATMTMHSVGISNVKDHSKTADKQLGISGKQQAESEGLFPYQGSDLPEGQETASSDSDRLFWCLRPWMLHRRQAREMQNQKAFQPCSDTRVTGTPALESGKTPNKPRWRVNKEGCEFVRFRRLPATLTQCLLKSFCNDPTIPGSPYGGASRSLPAQFRIMNPQKRPKEHKHFSAKFL